MSQNLVVRLGLEQNCIPLYSWSLMVMSEVKSVFIPKAERKQAQISWR